MFKIFDVSVNQYSCIRVNEQHSHVYFFLESSTHPPATKHTHRLGQSLTAFLLNRTGTRMATPPQINSDNCALHGDSAENEVDSDLPHLILTFLSVSEAILVQEVAGAIGIPNMDTFVSKFLSVGAALNEPQQLLNNAAPEHALCSQQGEA